MTTEHLKRTQWFTHDRFGLFIHWGLYAIPARGEWVRNNERMTNEDYEPYFEQFNPVRYNPRAWARAAKQAGMKYAVMTTKHHDGFCLFDSQLTDYKATNTPAGRDLIREYVDAFRAEGLKVGFYYSLIDWHHPDYPAYDDLHHPLRGNEAYKATEAQKDFDRYTSYMHGQVRELLTNYGTVDIMWFDFSYEQMTGGKWRATELVTMMRSIQPDIVIDNRLGGNLLSANPEIYAGDFVSPEQILPAKGIRNEAGEAVPWEACITLNDHWGYHAHDHNYKLPCQVIRGLVECVSKNGNLLLNVGPNANGEIPHESLVILAEIGEWMAYNSDSIYGCAASSVEKPEWGRYTQCGNKLYAHILDRGIGPIALPGLAGRVRSARILADGSEVNITTPWNGTNQAVFQDCLFINLPSVQLPDKRDTVIELVLNETV
ncbi:alpha-L-fucosidase [Paenibacillus taiwanensis]|uniref:alpha-L-fucosidase n=1 Tax=Paenibacillus taiwanensis TaxID=401638 RepID=UPI00042349A3|nr:alpha-L-fucosidase [Paenibacillus taiwanensis]